MGYCLMNCVVEVGRLLAFGDYIYSLTDNLVNDLNVVKS
jgi:hypothetical protein